jgi:hypothetical protein
LPIADCQLPIDVIGRVLKLAIGNWQLEIRRWQRRLQVT